VVGSNRFRGLGTPLGNFKLLEGAVPLARHARDSLDQFFVLLQQCRLLIVRQRALGLRIQSGRLRQFGAPAAHVIALVVSLGLTGESHRDLSFQGK
jgi:hypothetical protein